MYWVIPQNDRKQYSYKQLKEKYNGKWLYLVNSEFTDDHEMLRAIPVVIADSELEGIENGVYEPFQDEMFGITADADFTNVSMPIPCIFVNYIDEQE
jgi:hypothetical protein